MSRWARRNVLGFATAVAVMSAVGGVAALVLVISNRGDAIRQAEIIVAGAEGDREAVTRQPVEAIRGGPKTPGVFDTNQRLRTRLSMEVRALRRIWPNTTTAAIASETSLLNAARARVLELIDQRRTRAAQRLETDAVLPASRRLSDLFRQANGRLQREAADGRRYALVGTFVLAGGAGMLLVIMMVSVTGVRRRHQRAETEDRMLRESEERLRALVQNGSDMITVVAPDTTVLYQAGSVDSMLGYRPEELEGTKLTEWLHPADASPLLKLCASDDPSGQELRLRCRDGSLRVCEARATSLLDHPSWGGIVLAIRDVSERKALEEELRYQAFHDGLTGLANRALFGDRLEHALARSTRTQDEIAVLMIDLDDFKSINDSLGHPAGDRLLREVAGRLSSSVRASDTIARVGGDEFAVILEKGSSGTDYETAAARILQAFAEPIEVGARRLAVTASVGVARAAPGSCDADQLMGDADLAMYSAKARGGGKWAVFRPEMHDAIQERLQLKADLLRAVAIGEQLDLHYQPIVALDDGAIVGLEALLRWNHPTRGRIAPRDFIPLAEETGAIVPIGRWVLRKACMQGQRWVEAFVPDMTMAVNVSARQLDTESLIDDVRHALGESGLAPERLVLEITESELMSNVERAARTLRAVRKLGVRIAIDDFGTGYSSLGQLQHLPVDILKVDRVFAETVGRESENGGLLRAVMEIGKSLHLSTIVEGIETPTQLKELQALACPFGQGYLFSRPVRSQAIDMLLARPRATSNGGAKRALALSDL